MIASVEDMIRSYVAAWNEKGLPEFTKAFAECWVADASYTDPNFEGIKGVDGIAGLANLSLEKLPVRTFYVLALPDHHHNVGRYTWKVDLPEETREGFDYFEFNEDFKITRLVSFFGQLK